MKDSNLRPSNLSFALSLITYNALEHRTERLKASDLLHSFDQLYLLITYYDIHLLDALTTELTRHKHN